MKMVRGLLTCDHCRERLVVSWSGHYVRDPFTIRQLASSQRLRRQSRPLARILRDSGLTRHPSLMTIISSLLLAGITVTWLGGLNLQQNPLQIWVNQISRTSDGPNQARPQ